MAEVSEIVLRIPGPSEKGFLRRAEAVAKIQEMTVRMRGDNAFTVEVVDAIVDLLVEYAEVPNGADPREAIKDLSQEELMSALNALGGSAEIDEKKE